MTAAGRVLLVMARAPEPGRAKTRLAASLGSRAAADLAAAALLDTLAVVHAAGGPSVVALTGDVAGASRRAEVEAALAHHRLIPQRGGDFSQRLAHAHADAAAATGVATTVQVGMDTPQLSVGLLQRAADALAGADAALGPAEDGGWWCLALRDAAVAACLAEVAMSLPDTGARTAAALRRAGATVATLPTLRDVDTESDAAQVAGLVPDSRFGRAFAASTPGLVEGAR